MISYIIFYRLIFTIVLLFDILTHPNLTNKAIFAIDRSTCTYSGLMSFNYGPFIMQEYHPIVNHPSTKSANQHVSGLKVLRYKYSFFDLVQNSLQNHDTHICLVCRYWRYSFFHLVQNPLQNYDTKICLLWRFWRSSILSKIHLLNILLGVISAEVWGFKCTCRNGNRTFDFRLGR